MTSRMTRRTRAVALPHDPAERIGYLIGLGLVASVVLALVVALGVLLGHLGVAASAWLGGVL